MAVVDISILVVIAVSSVIGIIRGLIKEALSLAAWVAAIVIGGLFSQELAGLLTGLINNDSLRRITAFAILFVATIFIGTLISNLVVKLTTAAGLRGVDRVLGGLFGFLRGLIIIVLFVMITQPFEFTSAWYRDSVLVPYIAVLIDKVQGMVGSAEDVTA